jgi:hypothetical protein
MHRRELGDQPELADCVLARSGTHISYGVPIDGHAVGDGLCELDQSGIVTGQGADLA